MDYFDLNIDNKDYYVPLTKKEMIEKLEYYKVLTLSYDKESCLKNKEYYELIDSLINLEISSFDIKFASYTIVPNILRDVLKYNVWHITKNVIESFHSKQIVLKKEGDFPGTIEVYNTIIADLNLKPGYAFNIPSINIDCYENDYEHAKDRYSEFINKNEMLQNELNTYDIEQLIELADDKELKIEDYFRLQEKIEEVKKELKFYKKNLCLYKNSIYKEVAYALLEEYHLPNEVGKTYKKNLPWITVTRKSL